MLDAVRLLLSNTVEMFEIHDVKREMDTTSNVVLIRTCSETETPFWNSHDWLDGHPQ